MRCEEVQELLPDYAENLLNEVARRRVDNHLASCSSCRADYKWWKESGDWIKADREEYYSVTPSRSIVDAVMARILSEEKWAIPIGRKIFTVTAKMRRLGASAAVILLMLFSFTLYLNSSPAEQANALVIDGELMEIGNAKTQVISSSMQSEDDGTYVVEVGPHFGQEEQLASATASIIPLAADPVSSEPSKPNYSIVFSVFGILVTVITMSWLTRV